MNIFKLLQTITAFPAVSGNEQDLIKFLKIEAEKLSERVTIDDFGNLICQKGRGNEIAVFAHADKIGFRISKFGREVEAVGLFEEVEEKIPIGKIFEVDIGVRQGIQHAGLIKRKKNKILLVKTENKNLEIGDFVTYSPNFRLNKSGKILSQGLDNGLGVVAAFHFLKYLKSGTVVFSIQEEMGFYGAQAAAGYLKPKKVLIVDTTYADDPRSAVKLGGGVVFCLKDNFFSDPKMVAKAIRVCNLNNLKFQLEVLVSGKSDIAGVYAGGGVVPHLFVGIPIKNMHTSGETSMYKDLDTTLKFLEEFASDFRR